VVAFSVQGSVTKHRACGFWNYGVSFSLPCV